MSYLDEYRGRRVLVTGGAGVIGRELVASLVDAGARVVCADLKPRPAVFPAEVDYIEGDANELASDDVAGVEYCFHLAATFERSVETPEFWDENFWHNVRLSHHLMGLLHLVPELRRVVFASSYLIYDPALYSFDTPRAAPVELTEGTPIYPRNICGAAKLIHELELRFLTGFGDSAWSAVTARIFRVYGKGSRDVVSRWVRSLLADQSAPLTVFRKEGIFDYIYAGDVAEGLLRLGASDATGVVNLGTGRARSVEQLLAALRERFPALRFVEEPAEIPFEAHQADMTRFEAVTGWRPQVSLEDGIERLIAHERSAGGDGESEARAVNVLITSASRKVTLIERYRDALRHGGFSGRVWGADIDPECVASGFVDGFWQMPRLDELEVAELVRFCADNRISLIVPTRDGELEWFANARDELAANGVHVLCSHPDTIRTCLDKLAFWRACEKAEVPAIPTYTSLPELCRHGFGDAGIVVKERFGAGASSMALGVDAEDAGRWARRLEQPIFQPEVEGTEYSVDLYVDRHGNVIECVPRTRHRVHAGESVVSETVDQPELVRASLALAEMLDLRGHCILQAFVDEHGRPRFIEANPRVGGASTLGFEAGCDTPRWSLIEACGLEIAARPGGYRRGLRMVRRSVDKFVTR